MRKLVLWTFLSLDGVAETPEKWQGPFWDSEVEACAAENLSGADALLLGRRTYEIFLASWPSADGPAGIADRMNSLPKYVVATTLDDVTWNASIVVGDVTDQVNDLKSQQGKDILVCGSIRLARSLMTNGLIDEYRIWVHPVIVGSGQRLFEPGLDHTDLRLTDTRIGPAGIAMLTYQPAAR